jgi:hypothetical protein
MIESEQPWLAGKVDTKAMTPVLRSERRDLEHVETAPFDCRNG